ncbi:Heat shock protein 70 family protein [Dioscorea alata]|uniref:Heat shock protein 70 family protein n=1 Tax=Dioscorea alata TaxID=55571 RepID=A0ACB7UNT8_DIOAL|nr:Heat shock protein 70 family protein [Dioscorea alata]
MNSPPRIADDKMIAVGFDVGNDNCVIAALRDGVVDVLLDDEPSRVSFSDEKRFIGSSASSLLNPSTTFSEIKDLLLSQPGGSHRIPFIKKEITVTNVHLLGMLLSHLKLTSERFLGVSVSKCVISLPSFADQSGRRAYLQAAQLAGLEPLRLIHDTTATALAYGIYEADFSDGEILVIFVDVGHCHTQVSVVAFNSDGLRVLSHAADRRLGGHDFDEILFKHFVEQFKDEYKIDVSSNAKASIRLKAACEKVKKDLSANEETSMIVECLMDDKDVKVFIKREEFEKLASGLLERVLLPCKNALSDARVEINEVRSVRLGGSMSAIPAITRILSSFFGKEPSRTLNECVARGCALQCAMLTPGFKIKNYQVREWLPYSVGFEFGGGRWSEKYVVWKGEPFPTLKKTVVSVRGDILLLLGSLTRIDENGQPLDGSQKIATFLSGPVPMPLGKTAAVTVRILVDIHGIVILGTPASWYADGITDLISSDTSCSNSYIAEARKVVEINTSKQSEPASNSLPVKVDGQVKGRPWSRFDRPVDMHFRGALNCSELVAAGVLEMELADQDKLVERTKDRKNELQAFVNEVSINLLERYCRFATETERTVIFASLAQTKECLNGDGDDLTENFYDSELLKLKKLLEPIVNRFKEEEDRLQATRELVQCIVDYKLAVESWTTYERDVVFNECDIAEQWLRDKNQLQDSLPKNRDPVLWSREIKERTASFDASCRQILKHGAPPSGSRDMQTD